jgi:hypothetical protein
MWMMSCLSGDALFNLNRKMRRAISAFFCVTRINKQRGLRIGQMSFPMRHQNRFEESAEQTSIALATGGAERNL